MMRVRNRPGVARLPLRMILRPKSSETRSGRPRSRLSRISWSKKIRPVTGASSIWVRENSACSTDSSYRYPAAASSAVNGYGSRRSSRPASAVILPSSRPSQIACTAATSSTAANALSSGTNPMPALAACRLAYSLPSTGTAGRYTGSSRRTSRTPARNADIGITARMPTARLCRTGFLCAGHSGFGCPVRHFLAGACPGHRASRKARRLSGGVYRPSGALPGASRASACSLSFMSACR